ncbi:MAG TPA: IS110 family transposase [Draconibacterium sp.]|nr:IS110 family transposase [Draconibacterium sp.]
MQAQITKKIDFSGQNLYIGLDVHKKSWHVTVLSEQICLQNISQPPSVEALYIYLTSRYPGAKYYSAYEAGFCGFNHHRNLIKHGISNIVINPADIPRSNKDSHYKTDKNDSRRIAESLRGGFLKGIHVFNPKQEEFRSLFRSRLALAKDIRTTKGRIKSFFAYRTIEVPEAFIKNPKSKQYITWLEQLKFSDSNATYHLRQLISRLKFLHEQRRLLEQELRNNARQIDRELYNLLLSVPGIGQITAIGIMAEIGDINRFVHFKNFASYVGLIPRIKQSGETERIGSITYRHNNYLRPLIVEASWQAIRADVAMLAYFQEACKKSNSKKALIKVARKLLSKIYFVMRNRKKYERGIA